MYSRRLPTPRCGSCSAMPVVIKRILNHAEGDTTAIYERHGFDAEKRAALDAWARRLHQIVTGEAPSRVVPLRGA